MKIEGSPTEFFAHIPQAERLAINQMQIELMSRRLGNIRSLDDELHWVELYSKAFREIITAQYELVGAYQTNSREPLEKIETLLYGKEELLSQAA